MNNILPKDAIKIIEDNIAIVIDVRTSDEFSTGHIPGAKNVNFNDALFAEKIAGLDKNAKYIINCQTGGRSARATSLMQELGFKDVANLEGGINAWRKEGFEVA